MKEGFYHVSLDKTSNKICTVITSFGKYRFKKLPSGLCCNPEVFQRVNEESVSDIMRVQICFDTIIIIGKDKEKHNLIIDKVLKLVKENNVNST